MSIAPGYTVVNRFQAGVMSTGFRALAYAGMMARNLACRDSLSSGTTRPSSASRSVSSTPVPPELVITATRGPRGTGWLDRARAASRTWRPVRTRTTPAWRSAASRTASSVASAAVCETAARCPALVRPPTTAMTGLSGVVRQASAKNPRASVIDSSSRQITEVSGSWRR